MDEFPVSCGLDHQNGGRNQPRCSMALLCYSRPDRFSSSLKTEESAIIFTSRTLYIDYCTILTSHFRDKYENRRVTYA